MVIQVRVELLDQGHINVPVHVLGQGLVPVSSDQLSSKFIIFCHKEVNVPLRKDVPEVNLL